MGGGRGMRPGQVPRVAGAGRDDGESPAGWVVTRPSQHPPTSSARLPAMPACPARPQKGSRRPRRPKRSTRPKLRPVQLVACPAGPSRPTRSEALPQRARLVQSTASGAAAGGLVWQSGGFASESVLQPNAPSLQRASQAHQAPNVLDVCCTYLGLARYSRLR